MKQGYIYKIRHIIEPEDVVLPYIGSTWTSLSNRFCQHKWLYKKWLESGGKECATYKLFTDYGIDSFEIIELERYDVEDKQQLRKWEQYWMNQIQCCNKVRAVMKPKPVHDAEYYQKKR